MASTKSRKFFVVYTMVLYIAFGALAAIAAVAGIVFLFFAPPLGLGLVIVGAVLGVLSWQVKKSFDSVTADAGDRPSA